MNGESGASLIDLLFDLYPGQEALLFHVLICSSCRERASAALLERHGTRLALPVGGLASLVGRDCDPSIPVDGLLDELLAHPREQQRDLLEEPRFQDGLLVQPLLTRSRQEQLRDWELSEHLAFLAVWLAGRTLDDGELQRAMIRGAVLTANARRLAGRLEEAEMALSQPEFAWAPKSELARLWRAVALVHWEQGRLEGAVELMEESERLFAKTRLPTEEGETKLLLGLLYAEAGLLPQCAGALLGGLRLRAAEARPWLAARACLTLAGVLAELDCPEDARLLLRRGRQLIPQVEDPAEATFLHGLAGAALCALGDAGEMLRNAAGTASFALPRHLRAQGPRPRPLPFA